MAAKDYAGKPLVERARRLRKEQTPFEAALWERLRAHRFEGLHFRRQHQLGRYIADFYCAELKLVIELDGSQHKRPSDQSYDQERDQLIQSLGLKVLRFPNQAPIPSILEAVSQLRAP
jgi:type I restriction enzyme R subunit